MAARAFVSTPDQPCAARGATHAVTSTSPHNATAIPLMPASAAATRARDLQHDNGAREQYHPADKRPQRDSPGSLHSADARHRGQWSFAGQPQGGSDHRECSSSGAAATPTTIKFGVKCVAIVPPEPASIVCPSGPPDSSRGGIRSAPRTVPRGRPPPHPHRHAAEQPDRLRADRADRPHHRAAVLDGQEDGVHRYQNADQDARQHIEVEALCCVLEHGGLVRAWRACRCDSGDDAVDIFRDVGTLPRQNESGRGVMGRAEQASPRYPGSVPSARSRR